MPKASLREAKRRSNPGAAKRLWIASPGARNDGRGHDLTTGVIVRETWYKFWAWF